MKLTIDQAIDQLVPMLAQRKIVIFVGSGISVSAGLPTWDELLRKFVVFCKDLQDLLDPDERFDQLITDAESQIDKYPTRVASVLKERLVELQVKKSKNIHRAYQQWLSDTFQSRTPHENHRLIVGTNYPQILTSNYDMLLEEAAKLEGYRALALLNTFTYKDADKVAGALYNQHSSIIHVHGDIQDIVLDEIVFTAQDYVTIERKYPGFTMALQSLFLNYSVLFVGYGGSDPHFEKFVEDISYSLNWAVSDCLPRTYLALHKDKVGEVLSKYKHRLRTDVISLDGYDQTTVLLKALQHSAPRGK